MNNLPHDHRATPLRRPLLVLLLIGGISLLPACDQALVPIVGQAETSHAQEIATFLEDFAREVLAAYLF